MANKQKDGEGELYINIYKEMEDKETERRERRRGCIKRVERRGGGREMLLPQKLEREGEQGEKGERGGGGDSLTASLSSSLSSTVCRSPAGLTA